MAAPTAGPIALPRYWAPETAFRASLTLASGTLTLVRAIAAGMNPESRALDRQRDGDLPWGHDEAQDERGQRGRIHRADEHLLAPEPVREQSPERPADEAATPCALIPTATQNKAAASSLAPTWSMYSGRNGNHTFISSDVLPVAAGDGEHSPLVDGVRRRRCFVRHALPAAGSKRSGPWRFDADPSSA